METFDARQANLYEWELSARCAAIADATARRHDCTALAPEGQGMWYTRAGEHFLPGQHIEAAPARNRPPGGSEADRRWSCPGFRGRRDPAAFARRRAACTSIRQGWRDRRRRKPVLRDGRVISLHETSLSITLAVNLHCA